MKFEVKDVIQILALLVSLITAILGFMQGRENKASLSVTNKTIDSIVESVSGN